MEALGLNELLKWFLLFTLCPICGYPFVKEPGYKVYCACNNTMYIELVRRNNG